MVDVISARWQWSRLIVAQFVALILGETVSDAAESSSERPPADLFEPVGPAFQPVVKHSIFVFGGRMSSTDIWSTAILNLNDPNGPTQNYDNYIVGAAYQRDFIKLGGVVFVGGEIGLADRFGRYPRCCTPVVTSPNIVHSPEFWGGLALRYEAITVSDVRFSPGIVWGLMCHHEADWSGSRSGSGSRRQRESTLLPGLGGCIFSGEFSRCRAGFPRTPQIRGLWDNRWNEGREQLKRCRVPPTVLTLQAGRRGFQEFRFKRSTPRRRTKVANACPVRNAKP
jgi:hypothetical protein